MTKDEITAAVRALVADSLAVPLDMVKPESSLIDDLGADSLDFVDILFQIEKKCGVKIKLQELNLLSGRDFSSPLTIPTGPLPPETVERLKEWVPALRKVEDPSKITPAV